MFSSIHPLGTTGAFGSDMYIGYKRAAFGCSTDPPPPLPPHPAMSWYRHSTHRFLKGGVSGLAFLHSKGIVHADVKPDNFMTDRNLSALKITDFGFAGRECRVSRSSGVVGSPEQISHAVLVVSSLRKINSLL